MAHKLPSVTYLRLLRVSYTIRDWKRADISDALALASIKLIMEMTDDQIMELDR